MKAARPLPSFWLLGLILGINVLLASCGGKWFPKCDDPTRPNGGCPPVEPEYPSRAGHDAAVDG